ncbi:hypothetical protein Tfer_3212 [Thermincola ferriacetica]|uniref:AAA+ ATPase domain-containing protein n=1 Tax=Thermincola ferriacetica TaxID=281456 RepID=A0A0L6VYJ9_9FIRM|nr:ATP-binding protein [Thermincola ferriacetica]KNZ68238.1 hypothetical protein Tfer_3212 [Thermincola ferriacetica]
MPKKESKQLDNQLFQLQLAFAGLSLYRNLLTTDAGTQLYNLLSLLRAKEVEPLEIVSAYHTLLHTLCRDAELTGEPCVGDAWQNFLLDFIITDENPFSLQAQKMSLRDMSPSLIKAAGYDMKLLQQLFYATSVVKKACGFASDSAYPDWHVFGGQNPPSNTNLENHQIKNMFMETPAWESCLEKLADFYQQKGCGIFAKYIAFKWSGEDKKLKGIPQPDPVRLDNLVGYKTERKVIIDNTRQFIAGYPANNILLYGDRGTGKSSTVKALLNEFFIKGLRLVEMTKKQLSDLPSLLDVLKRHPQKFIIFIDDLSFEETETEYLALKAILEGSLEARPANVLIYATSNRRHLVKEKFSDRTVSTVYKDSEEIRIQDTMQEKLSLSDRFGITVIFPAPDQKTYLEIVENLAIQRSIALDPAVLRQRAIQWSMLHNGRSGRSAKQFIDQLEGELALEKTHF